MSSSDYKESANHRRNERQSKSLDDNPSNGNKKKDTKRWCRGKVGVEHKTECRNMYEAKGWQNGKPSQPHNAKSLRERILVCVNCGKELAIWFGRGDKPEWVDK